MHNQAYTLDLKALDPKSSARQKAVDKAMAHKIVTLLTQGKPVGSKLVAGERYPIIFTDTALARYLEQEGTEVTQTGKTFTAKIRLVQDLSTRPSHIPGQYRVETIDKELGKGTFGLVRSLGLSAKPGSEKPTRAATKVLKEMVIEEDPKKGELTRQIELIYREYYFLQLQLAQQKQRVHLSFRINESGQPVAQFSLPRIAGKELFDIIADISEDEYYNPGNESPLPLSERLAYAIDTANGLVELHNLGIAHRDFKSPNILADRKTKTASIIDLGLAELIGNPGAPLGSPDTIAPEIVKGAFSKGIPVVTDKLDTFGFGIVMAQLLGAYVAGDERAVDFIDRPDYHITDTTLDGFLGFNGPNGNPIKDSLPDNCRDELTNLALQLGRNDPDARPDLQTQVIPILVRSQVLAYMIEKQYPLTADDKANIYRQLITIQQLASAGRIDTATATEIARAFATLKNDYQLNETEVTNLLFLKMNIETLTQIKSNTAVLKGGDDNMKTLANNIYTMVETIKQTKVTGKRKTIAIATIPENPVAAMFTQLKRNQLMATKRLVTSESTAKLGKGIFGGKLPTGFANINKLLADKNLNSLSETEINDLFDTIHGQLAALKVSPSPHREPLTSSLYDKQLDAYQAIKDLENEPKLKPKPEAGLHI